MPPIFISHSSRDNAIAASWKRRLEESGHAAVFLDFDPEQGIPAGREWERELYARIRACQAMVVLCSEASMASRWCFMEITHARALGKPLFAIRIDDAKLDGVLADRQAIDVRIGEEQAFAQLMRGMTVAGLDPANAFRRDATRPPYPGMLAFEEEDAAVFFGRGEEIARGLELLNRIHHLGEPLVVMVLGGSGTGKSSLVRAGLIPRLRRNHELWLIVGPVRPRTDPLDELASSIRRAFEQMGAPRTAQEIDQTLRDDRANGLTVLLTELRLHSGHADGKVLLVIDQFEELLTTERSDAAVVLRNLRHATEHGDRGIVILGTMRSDFLDRFQSHRELIDLRYDAVSLGPMSKEDIAEVITGPAREAEIELAPDLVDALIADGAAPGALPLLAFTLRELWEKYGGDRKLTANEYRDGLGGLQSVVGRVAENVLTTARITRGDEQALRAAFMAMLRITADGRYVRRLRNWSDFPDRVHPLLERFVQARLLASDRNGGKRTVEVTHERIFDSWKRLQQWIAEDTEALRLGNDIEAATQSWMDAARDHATEDEYLWRGARVSRAAELMSNGTLLLDESGHRFIDASHAAEEAEIIRREKQRRRRLFSLAIFAAVAVVLAIFASLMAARAQSNEIRAEEATGRANASALAADERARIADIDRARALTAQNFAEYQRVLLRAQENGLDADVRRSLEVIAPKYQDQAKQYEAAAQRMQQSLDEWRRLQGIETKRADSLLSLEVLRAGSGTAFLVHYGKPASPRHILIDGGDRRTFRGVLEPRLEQLRGIHRSGTMPLELVIASQTDFAHIDGLIPLIENLRKAEPPYRVSTLWSNAFVPEDEDDEDRDSAPRRMNNVQRKAGLVVAANMLGIPVNTPFSKLVMRPEAGAARMNRDEGLSITVLSPPVDRMRTFAKWWVKRWHDDDRELTTGNTPDYDVIEDFASPSIELLASPREVVNPPTAGGKDASVPNLASIVTMLELDHKRILFTADARDDLLLASLAQAGYTDDRGAMDVDVLVVPHGGSETSIPKESSFFRRVKARYYVISNDGTHRNPRISVMKNLFDARRNDPRPFTIVLTYTPQEMNERTRYPGEELCQYFAAERSRGVPFEVLAPRKSATSVGVDLLSAATFVPAGTRGVCP